MKILKQVFFILFFIIISTTAYSDGKLIAVAGFINLGAAKDNNLNMVITKSLILYLSKIPNITVIQYDAVAKSALKSGLWAQTNINMEEALSLGQEFSCDKVVIGEYNADDKNNQITINVYAYDVVTAELKMKRTYTGTTGLELFDNIDNMIKNVTGVLIGRNISFGKAVFNINNSDENYKIVLNGSTAGYASKNAPLTIDVLTGESSVAQIHLSNSDELLFQTSVNVNAGETVEIEYVPMGKAIAKLGKNDAKVYVDGEFFTNALKGESIDITNLTAGTDHKISIKKASGNPEVKMVNLKEAETVVLIFDEFKFPFRISGFVSLGLSLAALGGGFYFNNEMNSDLKNAEKNYEIYENSTTDLDTKWKAYTDMVAAAKNSSTMSSAFFISSGILFTYGVITGFLINEEGNIFVGVAPNKLYIMSRF